MICIESATYAGQKLAAIATLPDHSDLRSTTRCSDSSTGPISGHATTDRPCVFAH